jgi:glycosyltransferase involved in cell wall biosynthesis
MRRTLVLVAHKYPDGGGISSLIETYVSQLGADYDVHLVAVESDGDFGRLAIPRERIHVVGYSNAINPLLFPSSVLYTLRVTAYLRRLTRALHADVVIAQDALNVGPAATLAGVGLPVKTVVMDHGTLTNVHEDGWLDMFAARLGSARSRLFRAGFLADVPWRALRWRMAVARAHEVWFTGEELAPWFGRAGGRARRYSQSVPTGFAAPTAEERRAARARLGIDEHDTVVNYVGRLDGEKGLDTIVDALSGIHDAPVPWRVLIAGEGSLGPWLEQQVRGRGLDGRVALLGRLGRDGVRELQNASDFHLYAGTISCGVSVCLLEAMATGVVPIVSDVPRAQRDIVGDAGWVFRAGAVDELRTALSEAFAATEDRRAALRVRVQERLDAVQEPTIPELVGQLLGTGR